MLGKAGRVLYPFTVGGSCDMNEVWEASIRRG